MQGGDLSRENLEQRAQRELRTANPHRPRLLLVEMRDARAVVKDYRPCGWLLREVFGPKLLGREEAIYRVLEGCPGVPRVVGRVDRQALAVEYIEGRNAGEYADGTLPPEFFTRLREVVDAIHARGVVHCDLKNRQNVVVAEGYHPYIVDFSTAFTRRGRFGLLRRAAYQRFLLDDEKAVVKAKLQMGKLWDPAEAEFAFHRGPGERAVRRIRDSLRWTFKLLSRGGR
jgi:hypothetical protein